MKQKRAGLSPSTRAARRDSELPTTLKKRLFTQHRTISLAVTGDRRRLADCMNRRDFLNSMTVLAATAKSEAATFYTGQREEEVSPRVMKVLETTSGVHFGLLGQKQARPAPTLFIFSNTMQHSLEDELYGKVGWVLAERGFISVSLDLPCHGADRRPGESENGLDCWRQRLEKGENFMPAFISRVSAVLDFLIGEGYTDPQRVAACGTSRGGFVALHVAVADQRVNCVVAFIPVTNLLALSEFAGMERNELTRSLELVNCADKFAHHPIWICIGNHDSRVGTNNAIAFAQMVMEAAAIERRAPLIELHIVTSEGHNLPADAHEKAAKWILGQPEA
jgi:dienelactone hydrolase